MPAPQATAMQELAKTQFRTFAITLPKSWKPDMGFPSTFVKSFKQDELSEPPMTMPPALFLAATPNKYHVNSQRTKTQEFGNYIDGISSAICSAWSQWQSLASMTGIVVNAVVATGGAVVGPPWMPLIMASAPKKSPMELKYSTAIAQAISNGWMAYQATIKVPGLPWYPAFAAVPSPVAPPVPNVPVPVAALTQVAVSVGKAALKGAMVGNFGDPTAAHSTELFDAVADAFEKCFQLWQASTMVTNALGTGPVPTFAPPFVPVGPVVGGVANMPPGGFA